MDFVKKFTEGGKKEDGQDAKPEHKSGGFMDKINSMAGGGKESEKDEDVIDKGEWCTAS